MLLILTDFPRISKCLRSVLSFPQLFLLFGTLIFTPHFNSMLLFPLGYILHVCDKQKNKQDKYTMINMTTCAHITHVQVVSS